MTDQEPVLGSLRLYDGLRTTNSERVRRSEGSNVDHFTTQDGDEIAYCHLSGVWPFSTPGRGTIKASYENAANVALAIQHLNTGDGSIVPEVEGLNERCKVRFSIEFANSMAQGGVALGHVISQTNRKLGTPDRRPCAFIGAQRSAVSIPMSMVTGLLGYPQVSWISTSPELDDKSQYPLFGRTLPSDTGNAVPVIIYLRQVLNVKHLAVINVNDAYGNSFVEGMRKAAQEFAPDMELHQIPVGDDTLSIAAAVSSLKSSSYRYVFCLVFGPETHDALLTEAYIQDVAGNGKHNWLFADSFAGIEGRAFDKDSILHKVYRGTGFLRLSGGSAGIPSYDNYMSKVKQLQNPTDLEYLAQVSPKDNITAPFATDETFMTSLTSLYTPFIYEATIALGLSACSAYEENADFTGQDHFDHLKRTSFTGVSGSVAFDPETGSRDPSGAMYTVANHVEEEVKPGVIEFQTVMTNRFFNGNWTQQAKYVFNDGTTILPPDMPPLVEADDGTPLSILLGVPGIAAFVMGVIVFLFYENKRKKNDALWTVRKEELKFQTPPKIVGRGTFGVVLLAEYRGTQVAVKKVLPPRTSEKSTGTISTTSNSPRSSSGLVSGTTSGYAAPGVGTSSWGGMSLRLASRKKAPSKKNEAAAMKKLKYEFIEEMRYLSKLRHPCVTTIMGAVTSGKDPMLVMEFMEHGSLYDLLHNETMLIEGEVLLPILRDISQGMRFLHAASPQVIHGDLKAQNILVDKRFRAKVADFGLSQKRTLGGTGTGFWMAPELLRMESSNTTASDVYSFGITLYEVYSRREPYEHENPEEVLLLVSDKSVSKRPPAPGNMPEAVKSLMADCVRENAEKRPTFEELDIRLKRIDADEADSGEAAKAKNSHVSLFDIFPRHVAEALRDGRKVDPTSRESVTIFFSDIVGFTSISSELPPQKIADLLDRLYSKFDNLSHKHDVFKVETIGDAYMGVSNLVKDQPDDHAKRIAEFAIDVIKAANETLIDEEEPEKGFVNIRVGFHSGSVVADVVGTRNPRYCLFGDSVNTASRMESNSEVNRIHCSKASAKLLKKQWPDLKVNSRGHSSIKGKGRMRTYWVNEQEEDCADESESGHVEAQGQNKMGVLEALEEDLSEFEASKSPPPEQAPEIAEQPPSGTDETITEDNLTIPEAGPEEKPQQSGESDSAQIQKRLTAYLAHSTAGRDASKQV